MGNPDPAGKRSIPTRPESLADQEILGTSAAIGASPFLTQRVAFLLANCRVSTAADVIAIPARSPASLNEWVSSNEHFFCDFGRLNRSL